MLKYENVFCTLVLMAETAVWVNQEADCCCWSLNCNSVFASIVLPCPYISLTINKSVSSDSL